jgi:hypothetical protein
MLCYDYVITVSVRKFGDRSTNAGHRARALLIEASEVPAAAGLPA